MTATTADRGLVPWCCPPPSVATRYLHFTSTDRARRIVAQRRLWAGPLVGVCAVPEGGRLRPSTCLTDSIAAPPGPFGMPLGRPVRVVKDAAVLFGTDRPPDWCAPTEAQWQVRELALSSATAVTVAVARALLDGQRRLAYREPDGEPGCRLCAYSARCWVVPA